MDFRPRFSAHRHYNQSDKDRENNATSKPFYVSRLESALESDRGRIINSAAIRRLQQRTQVFPLEKDATVRSRLTHSLEVQQVGRFITRTTLERLGEEQRRTYGLTGLERTFESVVEMACLAHDIGNPPFGHFGEAAISDWFNDNFTQITGKARGDLTSGLECKIWDDLCQFEGNAQAIRLVVNLLSLNLTYTQIASLVKYTRAAWQPKPEKRTKDYYLNKKPGYFLAEEGFVNSMWKMLDMAPQSRHPATYIMEAADDIAYSIADLEDAVEKGLLTPIQLAEELKRNFSEQGMDLNTQSFLISFNKTASFCSIIDTCQEKYQTARVTNNSQFFVSLRVQLIHSLVNYAADNFIKHIEDILKGCYAGSLVEQGGPCEAALNSLKSATLKYAFRNRDVEELELKGYRIIHEVLNIYGQLLSIPRHKFEKCLDRDKESPPYLGRLASRLPAQHQQCYRAAVKRCDDTNDAELWELYYRCRLIQDFVSSMTDQYAYDEYQTLTAMNRSQS